MFALVYSMCVGAGGLALGNVLHPPCFLQQGLSLGPGALGLGKLAGSPRDLSVPASPVWKINVHQHAKPHTWTLGVELRSSGWCGQYFTDQALVPVLAGFCCLFAGCLISPGVRSVRQNVGSCIQPGREKPAAGQLELSWML